MVPMIGNVGLCPIPAEFPIRCRRCSMTTDGYWRWCQTSRSIASRDYGRRQATAAWRQRDVARQVGVMLTHQILVRTTRRRAMAEEGERKFMTVSSHRRSRYIVRLLALHRGSHWTVPHCTYTALNNYCVQVEPLWRVTPIGDNR